MARLRDELKEWRDPDGAAFALAVSLGLMDPDTPFATDTKHVFWSDNELGNAFHDILDTLVEVGALEHESEDDRYRWNPRFVWQEVSGKNAR